MRFMLRFAVLLLTLISLAAGAAAQPFSASTSCSVRCGGAMMRGVDTARARANTARLRPDLFRRMTSSEASVSARAGAVAATQWTFNVFNAATYSYDEVVGTLRFRGAHARIWVDTAAVNVTDAVILEMARALDTATAAGSRNPKQGIVQNDADVFGPLPVNPWSQDRSVDLLMTDVKEDSGSGTLLGFFSSTDLDPEDPFSNHMNLLYIDSREGLQVGASSLLSTVAHELQHLIHYARNPETERFYDEGCAEEASILNGYIDLGNGDFLTNTNVYLLRWNEGDEVMADYERAMTFIHYLREQLGESFLYAMVGDPDHGLDRIDYTLLKLGLYQSPWTASDLLESFAVANLLRTDADPRYGYRDPIPQGGTARIGRTYPIPAYPADTSYSLAALGSLYVAYTNPSNLAQGIRLRLTSSDASAPFTAMAVLHRNGQTEVRRLGGTGEYTIEGSMPFDTLVVALVSTGPATQTVRVLADPFVADVADGVSAGQQQLAMSVLPNPVSGAAVIRFTLPSRCAVSVTLFDERGAPVCRLADARFDAGTHLLSLNAGALADGYYVARLIAGGHVVVRPVVVAR